MAENSEWEEAKKKLLSIYSEKNNLSLREAEVLAEVIDGRTNAEISAPSTRPIMSHLLTSPTMFTRP
jgi:FixJ family two-component response regulator